jgi:uncharacterized protein
MPEPTAAPKPLHGRSLRQVVARRPVAVFLLLLYGTAGGLALIPAVTTPGLLPNRAILYGPLLSLFGCAVPAFAVTAIIGGADAVRDLARRCLRWRVALRWYLVALLGMPAATMLSAIALYGPAPLHALAEGWPLLLTLFLPTLAIMIVFYNLTEEVGFTGFLFARLQDRHGQLRAVLLTTIFFWVFHLPTFVIDTGSWALAGVVMAVLLLPHLASRLIVGWLYNATGASVLIPGLFHATFNSTVNPTGFAAAVLKLPPQEMFIVLNTIIVVAGLVVATATRGSLGRTLTLPPRTPSGGST